mgnify:CR=1 FL=1
MNDDWFDDVVDGKPIDAEYWQIDFIDSLLPRTALEIKGELGAPILNSRSEPRVGDQKNKQEKANWSSSEIIPSTLSKQSINTLGFIDEKKFEKSILSK